MISALGAHRGVPLLTCAALAGLDVVLLDGATVRRVDGGMEHVIVEVRQRAHCVEEQLVAVLALDVDQPVLAVAALADLHDRRAVLGRPVTSVTPRHRLVQQIMLSAADVSCMHPSQECLKVLAASIHEIDAAGNGSDRVQARLPGDHLKSWTRASERPSCRELTESVGDEAART